MKPVSRPANRLTRRNVLQGLLAGTAAIPMLNASRAHGQSDPPTRLVVFAQPNGTRNTLFWPTGEPAALTFPEYTAPLSVMQDKLLFLKGIRHCPAVVGDNGFNGGLNGSEHARGIGGLLTARPLGQGAFKSFMATSGWGSGISLDQHLAATLNPPTTFKTLELGVQVRDAEVRGRISYRDADQPIPPRESPADVFKALFGNAVTGADGDPAEADPVLEQLRAERRSVFDLSLREIDRLKLRLGADDKEKLDAHMTAIRDIEERLSAITPSAPVEGGNCSVPEGTWDVDIDADATLELTGQLQMDLAAAALACDQTRIITLQWNYAESEHYFPFLDLSRNHHTISHDWQGDGFTEYGKIQLWFSQQFLYLMNKLESYNEGERSLLDNSVVFWGSEIGESTSHDLTLMPYVLAGSAGGRLRNGIVDYGDAKKDNNQLLVSLAQLMGATEVTSFGDPSGASGDLPDILL
jgi:hypothetical protein